MIEPQEEDRIKTLTVQVARLQRQLDDLTERFEKYVERQRNKNRPFGPLPRPGPPWQPWPPSTKRLGE